ncbi:MAG: ATPase [Opitutus sp.]|nr:ATPase [Opitutus sp.]
MSPSLKSPALIKSLALPIALVVAAAFFATKEPAFLGARNLTQLLIEFSTVGTLALGMFLVILTGNIDLSVGSGVGLIGGIAAVLVFKHEWSAGAALATGLGAALVLWVLMGTLIVKQHIPSFIITLGGLLIFKGAFWLVIESSTVPVSRGDEDNLYSQLTTFYLSHGAGLALAVAAGAVVTILRWRGRRARQERSLPVPPAARALLAPLIGTAAGLGLVIVCNQFRGVPLSLVILGVTTALIYFVTRHTAFGRYLYAIGGNEEAARLSGIRVERVLVGAFAIMGAMVAVTGFLVTAYSGASTTTVGELMELDAIAACVIGGVALKGGRGTVWGVLLGALIMTVLLNGMTLMAVSPEIKFIARGVVLAVAVWLDVRFSRR